MEVQQSTRKVVCARRAKADDASVRLGTFFSGMEAIGFALRLLAVPVVHAFCVETNVHCRRFIRQNFRVNPRHIHKDVRKLCMRSLPDVDLFVAGPPCQPFSIAGKREGASTSDGLLVDYCLQYINAHHPRLFLIENVAGLQHQRHKVCCGHSTKQCCEKVYKHIFVCLTSEVK